MDSNCSNNESEMSVVLCAFLQVGQADVYPRHFFKKKGCNPLEKQKC